MFRLYIILVLALTVGEANGQNYARFSDVKPVIRDRYLESHALHLANRKASGIRCQERYVAAVIVSDDWQKVCDRSGDVIALELHMELYGEDGRGNCGITHFVFQRRLRADDTFADKMTIAGMGDFYYLDCE